MNFDSYITCIYYDDCADKKTDAQNEHFIACICSLKMYFYNRDNEENTRVYPLSSFRYVHVQ